MFRLLYIYSVWIDDDDRIREELKDLIDDNPIEESDGEDTDASGGSKKRKKSDDEEYDDRLEDEDYDLIEENLGVKVERRVCFILYYIYEIIGYYVFFSQYRNLNVYDVFKTKKVTVKENTMKDKIVKQSQLICSQMM